MILIKMNLTYRRKKDKRNGFANCIAPINERSFELTKYGSFLVGSPLTIMLHQLQTIECTYKVLSNFDDATYLFAYGKYCAISHCFIDANRIPDWELSND